MLLSLASYEIPLIASGDGFEYFNLAVSTCCVSVIEVLSDSQLMDTLGCELCAALYRLDLHCIATSCTIAVPFMSAVPITALREKRELYSRRLSHHCVPV